MESHLIEYKSTLTPDTDLEKEVVAFLNSRTGGRIFIGIDNSGHVIGVDNADKPTSSKQKYRLTQKGREFQKRLKRERHERI